MATTKTTAKKTAAKKPAAKKTAAKKAAPKKPAGVKTEAAAEAVKTVKAVEAEALSLQARIEEVRGQVEKQVADVRGALEGALDEVREISLDNFRAMDRDALKGFANEAQDAAKAAGETAVAGLREVNAKLLDIVEANVLEGFKNARAVVAAQSVQDAVELQRDFVRGQIEAYVDQVKDLVALSRKNAEAAAKPLATTAQASWGKFKDAA